MRYYIDTEFIEGPQTKRFLGIPYGKTKPTIDLISIGIVSEDGKEYYAISKDFNLKEAWNRYDLELNKLPRHDPSIESDVLFARNKAGYKKVYWLRENVLKPIFKELCDLENDILNSTVKINGEDYTELKFTKSNLKYLINKYGKTNKQIAREVKNSICSPSREVFTGTYPNSYPKNVEFYAYYADYDWVAFCWLFGKMIDLPQGFPMYCRDIKQELDRKIMIKSNKMIGIIDSQGHRNVFLPKEKYSFEERLRIIKSLAAYPKHKNEHSAIADARWNERLHKFLNSF